ncbi:hypothetical protein D8780_09930 [Notoacmeibacter ruber]|uniref:Uncharacterized protein n=1 Tax=Notoacmeibacter ruber TaxID=2670375 RepID=A0A3L7JDT6_9HYPH|nr:hypothetical protein D8780_09930 [Notoacmeibacter ruber]
MSVFGVAFLEQRFGKSMSVLLEICKNGIALYFWQFQVLSARVDVPARCVTQTGQNRRAFCH